MQNVTGSFGATGNSSPVEGSNIDLIVGGTFVGTIQLQTAMPGAAGADVWVPVGSNLTAAGSLVFNGAIGRKFRVSCTAYTSGTAYYSLGASINEELI
jgi:hypothetical protein